MEVTSLFPFDSVGKLCPFDSVCHLCGQTEAPGVDCRYDRVLCQLCAMKPIILILVSVNRKDNPNVVFYWLIPDTLRETFSLKPRLNEALSNVKREKICQYFD